MRELFVGAAVIRRGGKVLLATRPQGKPPYGWEFPGGKLEPGESVQQALRRELREELGVESMPLDELYRLDVVKPELVIHLCFVRTLVADTAEFRACEGQEFAWFELSGEPPSALLAPDFPVWNFLTNFS